jgi:hypothetical protein
MVTQTKPKQKEKKKIKKQLIYYIGFLFINSLQLLSDYQILETFSYYHSCAKAVKGIWYGG